MSAVSAIPDVSMALSDLEALHARGQYLKPLLDAFAESGEPILVCDRTEMRDGAYHIFYRLHESLR